MVMNLSTVCVCVCVRACVRARACVRRACVRRACVRVCGVDVLADGVFVCDICRLNPDGNL